MKKDKTFFYFGAIAFITGGLADTIIGDIIRDFFFNLENQEELYSLMSSSMVSVNNLPILGEISFLNLYNTFSLNNGAFFIAFGLLLLLVVRVDEDLVLNSTSIIMFCIIVSLYLFLLSIVSLNCFLPPFAIFGIAFTSFTLAYVFKRKNNHIDKKKVVKEKTNEL